LRICIPPDSLIAIISEHFYAGCVFTCEGLLRVLVNAAAIKPGIAMDATAEVSLDALVREHARLVFRVAFSVLRNHHDAEDAAQETFLRVLRQGQSMDVIADPKAWLARIAWRVSLDRIRRTPRDGEEDWSILLDQLRAPEASAEQLASDAQMLRLTERMVANLPSDLRAVLTLSTVEELNSREIAEILGIPEGTVRTRLQRARQTLKEKLTELMKGGRR